LYLYLSKYIVYIGVNVSTPTYDTTSGLGGPCPAGSYCIEGTEDPIPCPNTTYRDTEGAEKLADCIPCKLGQYCGSENLTDATGPCNAGFYCYRGNNAPDPTGILINHIQSNMPMQSPLLKCHIFLVLS